MIQAAYSIIELASALARLQFIKWQVLATFGVSVKLLMVNQQGHIHTCKFEVELTDEELCHCTPIVRIAHTTIFLRLQYREPLEYFVQNNGNSII